MTGAATVVWFLGRKKTSKDTPKGVRITKSEGLQEAQRAVQESAARHREVSNQQGVVARVVHSLAEVRENNNFAAKIRTAMGGDE